MRVMMATFLATALAGSAAAQTADWPATEKEAIATLQRYVRIDTSNPPGDVSQGTLAPGTADMAPMFSLIHCAQRSNGAIGAGTVPPSPPLTALLSLMMLSSLDTSPKTVPCDCVLSYTLYPFCPDS